MRAGQADAFALSQHTLRPVVAQIPGSRIVAGGFQQTQVAVAVPKGRPAARLRHGVARGGEAHRRRPADLRYPRLPRRRGRALTGPRNRHRAADRCAAPRHAGRAAIWPAGRRSARQETGDQRSPRDEPRSAARPRISVGVRPVDRERGRRPIQSGAQTVQGKPRGGFVDGSREREKRDLKPLVIALVVVGLVFAGSIAGYWTWQTGSQQHTASRQSDGSATALPK